MTTRKPAPKKRAPAKRAKRRDAAAELLELTPAAFRRQLLAGVLDDLEQARAKGSMGAIQQLTREAIRLREQIAAAEADAAQQALVFQTTDVLVEQLLGAIAKLPEAVFEQVEQAVQLRRTGRPRMRIVQ